MARLRFRYLCGVLVALAVSLAVLRGDAVAEAGGNVCIGRNGEIKVERGTATCTVLDTSDAMAIGGGASAAHTNGSAMAIGDNAEAIAKDHSTATATGNGAVADALTNSTTTASHRHTPSFSD